MNCSLSILPFPSLSKAKSMQRTSEPSTHTPEVRICLSQPGGERPITDIHFELLVGMNSHVTMAPQNPSNCPQHSWEFHLLIQPPPSRKGREYLPLTPSSAMPCWEQEFLVTTGVGTSLPLRFPAWLHSKGADTDHCFTVSN